MKRAVFFVAGGQKGKQTAINRFNLELNASVFLGCNWTWYTFNQHVISRVPQDMRTGIRLYHTCIQWAHSSVPFLRSSIEWYRTHNTESYLQSQSKSSRFCKTETCFMTRSFRTVCSQITSVACNPEVQMIWNRVSSYSICLTRRFLWRHDHQNLFIFFSIQRQLRHAMVVLFISLPQNLASLACNFNCVPLCDDCRSYYSLIVMPISVMCYKWIYLYCTPICD